VTGEVVQQVLNLTRSLFDTENNGSFINWLRIWEPNHKLANPKLSRTSESVGSPLYYAASTGLLHVGQLLIDGGADVNAEGGYYDDALRAAIKNDHGAFVRLLIKLGADVNGQERQLVSVSTAD